jgi:hypothetical protein
MGEIQGHLGGFEKAEFHLTYCILMDIPNKGARSVASLLCAESMTICLKILALSALQLHIVAVR